MSVKQIREAIASGELETAALERLVIEPCLDVRGMQAGELYEEPEQRGIRMALVQEAIGTGQYDDWAVITDDSYWEPTVNYQALADAGVDAFMIRAYGPTSWTDGLFNPKPDKTYFAKFKACRATGKPVGAYVVHNPWEMVDNPQSTTFAQIQIKQWQEVFYGEFIPDFIALDCEIAYCYRGTNQITMPAPNLTDTIRWTLDAMIKQWRKPVWLYTRVTWMKEYCPGMMTVLDNFNADGTKVHLHLALYLTAVSKLASVNTPADFKAVLPIYSSTLRSYLEYGSTDVSTRIWQLGPIKHAACPTGAVDWNIIPLTPAKFYELIGFKGGVTPPPDTGGDTGNNPPPADTALTLRVTALENELDALTVLYQKHTHGTPTA